MRQEIKFQNREQGKAIESLNSLSRNYEQTLRLFGERTMHMDEMEEKIRTSAERRTALPFLDIRDALIRGREAGIEISNQKSFFGSAPKGIEGIIEGYDMSIRRFDRCLKLIGMEKTETVGKPFNAKTMKAIDKRPDSTVEPGIVVEEQLSGYIRFDEVIRTAEVIVSCEE
ncbi:nucleotide exchange factor GrpE [Desulfobacterales bacterium HSG16]|nr:nucleotide exchange factor GrpE [Desulfobacterales bacterium HSG16]